MTNHISPLLKLTEPITPFVEQAQREIIWNPLLDRQAPLNFSRAHYREILRSGGDKAEDLLDGFGINEDVLWPADNSGRKWTYKDWFAMLEVGSHLCGPDFAIRISDNVGLHMFPYMEEITATSPNVYGVLRMWNNHSEHIEPMIRVSFEPSGNDSHLLLVTYPLSGNLLDAFGLSCIALVCDMVRMITGERVKTGLKINLPDRNNNRQKFEEMHGVKIDEYGSSCDRDTRTKRKAPCLQFTISNEIVFAKGLTRDTERYNPAFEKFMAQIEAANQLYPVQRVSELAACIQSTADRILTCDEMAGILGYQSRAYTRQLKLEGYTHKVIVEATTSNSIRTMTKLGLTQKETKERLGINSHRQFMKYV